MLARDLTDLGAKLPERVVATIHKLGGVPHRELARSFSHVTRARACHIANVELCALADCELVDAADHVFSVHCLFFLFCS